MERATSHPNGNWIISATAESRCRSGTCDSPTATSGLRHHILALCSCRESKVRHNSVVITRLCSVDVTRLGGATVFRGPDSAPTETCHGDNSSPLPLLGSLLGDVTSGCTTVTSMAVLFFADDVDTFRVTVLGPEKDVSCKIVRPRTCQ